MRRRLLLLAITFLIEDDKNTQHGEIKEIDMGPLEKTVDSYQLLQGRLS